MNISNRWKSILRVYFESGKILLKPTVHNGDFLRLAGCVIHANGLAASAALASLTGE